jgi:hypothetical protein
MREEWEYVMGVSVLGLDEVVEDVVAIDGEEGVA